MSITSKINQIFPKGSIFTPLRVVALALANAIETSGSGDDISDIQSDISDIQSDISDIESDIDTVETSIAAVAPEFYFAGSNGWNLSTSNTDKFFSMHIDKSAGINYTTGKVYINVTGLYAWDFEYLVTNTSGGAITITIQLDVNGALSTTTLRTYEFAIGETKAIKGTLYSAIAIPGKYLSLKGKVNTGTLNTGTNNQNVIRKIG